MLQVSSVMRPLCQAGALLEEFLREAAISKQSFADFLGVARVNLWRWMTGVNPIPIDHAARIESITGIPSRMWSTLPELRHDAAHVVFITG